MWRNRQQSTDNLLGKREFAGLDMWYKHISKRCAGRLQSIREDQANQEENESTNYIKDLQKISFTWEQVENVALDRQR